MPFSISACSITPQRALEIVVEAIRPPQALNTSDCTRAAYVLASAFALYPQSRPWTLFCYCVICTCNLNEEVIGSNKSNVI